MPCRSVLHARGSSFLHEHTHTRTRRERERERERGVDNGQHVDANSAAVDERRARQILRLLSRPPEHPGREIRPSREIREYGAQCD